MSNKRKEKIGKRIKALRLAKGLRRADAAAVAGISYDYLAKIENDQRHPNLDVLGRVLGALGTTVGEFFAETAGFAPPMHGAPYPIDEWGLMELGHARAVPVIGWAQAGEWSPMDSEASDGEVVHSDRAREGCFALMVEGESMSPEFEPGMAIVVDPMADARPGDYVVARLEGESEAVFKQYIVRDGRPLLHALNPGHPDIELSAPSEASFIGVVVESKRFFNKPDRRARLLSGILARLSDMTDEELDEIAKQISG